MARDAGLLSGGEPREHVWGTAPDFVGPRHELRERLLLDLILSARPGARILNVGAGQGSFTRLLEERGYDVVSSDVSPAALAVLEDRVRGEVVLADVTSLPYPDASFDAVIAGEVIEHVEDDHQAVAELARVLRIGGVAALSVPAHPEWFGDSDRWAGHVRRYTRDRLEQLIVDAGLTVQSIRPWGFPVSALYHRAYYDRRASRIANERVGAQRRLLLTALRTALQIDRLFIGVERGCLGYLVLCRADDVAGSTSDSSSERH